MFSQRCFSEQPDIPFAAKGSLYLMLVFVTLHVLDRQVMLLNQYQNTR